MAEGSKSTTHMNNLLEGDGEDNFFRSFDDVYDSFDAMGLRDNLLKSIYAYGLEKPSQIQQRCIVPFCKGLDVFQQIESETEKIAVFCLGILQRVDYGLRQCQALVMLLLALKGELALQIVKVMEALGEDLGVKVCVSLGGNKPLGLLQTLADGVHVVVGTPGGVCGLLRRQLLRRDCIKMLVLDEASEILERGFKDQIHEMLWSLPTKIQVGVFSTIITSDFLEIARLFMHKPVRILVNRDE